MEELKKKKIKLLKWYMIKDAFANRPRKRKHLVSSSMEPHFPPLVQGPSDLLLRGNEAKKRKGNRRWFHCCTSTPGKAPENPASCHRDFSLLHQHRDFSLLFS